MKTKALLTIGLMMLFGFGLYTYSTMAEQPENSIRQLTSLTNKEKGEQMKLGAFSISLSVKDLKTSKEFYENLGFTTLGGGMEQNYLIMKNENSLIGLFQGMFEGNILTF